MSRRSFLELSGVMFRKDCYMRICVQTTGFLQARGRDENEPQLSRLLG